jgi:RNA polymerase sigma-70 factor, ECF subfamily
MRRGFDTSSRMCCIASYARRLVAIAAREGVAPADRLDVVHDAVLVLLGRPDLPDDTLTAIVRNAARNHRRRHHRARPHVPIGDVVLADANTPESAVERATAATQLACCMAELGEAHRHVVRLRLLEELSSAEAARALGLSAGHVAVLLHRARKQLAECMHARSP